MPPPGPPQQLGGHPPAPLPRSTLRFPAPRHSLELSTGCPDPPGWTAYSLSWTLCPIFLDRPLDPCAKGRHGALGGSFTIYLPPTAWPASPELPLPALPQRPQASAASLSPAWLSSPVGICPGARGQQTGSGEGPGRSRTLRGVWGISRGVTRPVWTVRSSVDREDARLQAEGRGGRLWRDTRQPVGRRQWPDLEAACREGGRGGKDGSSPSTSGDTRSLRSLNRAPA